MLDVFLCGDKVETLWRLGENIVENQWRRLILGGLPPEGQFQNGLESIKRDWAGQHDMQLLPGPRYAHRSQGEGSAVQLCVSGDFSRLFQPFSRVHRIRSAHEHGVAGILRRTRWPAGLR